jgi:cysteinyl-tRNA synthetase
LNFEFMIKFYNTLTRKKEEFKPIKNKTVGLYTCGPTVYDYAHLGNLRTYIFEDVLKRTLEYNGYKVKHVMNVTDVGHLVSDADEGEDKMMRALRRDGLEPSVHSLKHLANKYLAVFKQDLRKLNIREPDIWCKATEHIKEKGFAYETSDGVYFDTTKLNDYGKLTGQPLDDLEPGRRIEVNPEKKNPLDFALWIKAVGKQEKHIMKWPSPWGEGFPGWHTECSAMSKKYLSQPFDIHCGGIDHIPVHHTNEIAQSEAAYGVALANYWLHGEFLTVREGKMAKSAGTFIIMQDLEKKGIKPLAYRYLSLTAHYRSKLNFTWESLKAAENALDSIYNEARYWPKSKKIDKSCLEKFIQAVNDDLDTPRALAELWFVIKSKDQSIKAGTVLEFDKVLSLGLKDYVAKPPEIPADIKKMAQERERARQEKDFSRADRLRDEIESQGFVLDDTPQGPVVKIKY